MIYFIHISRFVVAFIFLYSFVTKLRGFAAFERAIYNFQLLRENLHRPAALGFMFGESLVFLAALLGGNLLFLSHTLAIILLGSRWRSPAETQDN